MDLKGKPTIVFDFDGVIHSYFSGWKGIDAIPDPPVDGIRETIDALRKKYRLVVVSSRCREEKGREAVVNWLDEKDIRVDDVTFEKVPAIVYVDDRALTFDGDAKKLAGQIRRFKPWHKR
ncbi:MAG TPA: hypothetical protein VFK27_03340 [Bacillales bacterium]|jgi:hypothetical protein|nr:hypothetical protein [Bacillales bacterium]